MTTHTIVIHPAHCWDGLVGAWSLGLDPKATTYIEYDHGKPEKAQAVFVAAHEQHDVTRVIAVDCFPEFIRGMADEVIVIDHHESARERLADRTGLTEVVFDQTHSAAVLAWLWAHPDQPVPVLHQAALETATDLLKEIDTAFQAAGPGAEEAMHEALLAAHDHLEAEALLKGNADE